MRAAYRSRATAGALLGCLGLAACAAGGAGITVPPGHERLAPCGPRQISVDELRSIGAPGCDPQGWNLAFPDGMVIGVAAVGDVFTSSDPVRGHEYSVVNWGLPGVGAATIRDGRIAETWSSSPDADDLQHRQLLLDGYR